MRILSFPFTCGWRGRRGGGLLAGVWVRTSGGLVHHHARVLGVCCVWMAIRVVVNGVLVLCRMGWDGRGDISTLTISWRAGRRILVVGRGRRGIWATIHLVWRIHDGGRVGGRGGGRGEGGGPGIWLEMGSEGSGGLERLIAYV